MGSDLLYMIQPRWRSAIQFGTSTMCSRSHNRYAERFAYEKKVWAPFAESLGKDGSRTGWSLNARVFPLGASTTFQAVTVDIVPSWKEIFQPSGDFANSLESPTPTWNLAPPSSNMKSCGRSFPQTSLIWMTTPRQQNDSHGGSNPVPLGLQMPGLNWVART